jgi:hypothetical protein
MLYQKKRYTMEHLEQMEETLDIIYNLNPLKGEIYDLTLIMGKEFLIDLEMTPIRHSQGSIIQNSQIITY